MWKGLVICPFYRYNRKFLLTSAKKPLAFTLLSEDGRRGKPPPGSVGKKVADANTEEWQTISKKGNYIHTKRMPLKIMRSSLFSYF